MSRLEADRCDMRDALIIFGTVARTTAAAPADEMRSTRADGFPVRAPTRSI
jgi:hypothetical protein